VAEEVTVALRWEWEKWETQRGGRGEVEEERSAACGQADR
jgi:hypothetical protein